MLSVFGASGPKGEQDEEEGVVDVERLSAEDDLLLDDDDEYDDEEDEEDEDEDDDVNYLQLFEEVIEKLRNSNPHVIRPMTQKPEGEQAAEEGEGGDKEDQGSGDNTNDCKELGYFASHNNRRKKEGEDKNAEPSFDSLFILNDLEMLYKYFQERERDFETAIKIGKMLVEKNQALIEEKDSMLNDNLVLKQWEQRVKFQQQTIDELTQLKQQYQNRIEELEIELDVNQRLLQSKVNLTEQLEVKLWDYIEELEGDKQEIEVESKTMAKHKEKVQRLTREMEHLESEIVRYKSLLSELKDKNRRLKKEVTVLQKLLKEQELQQQKKKQAADGTSIINNMLMDSESENEIEEKQSPKAATEEKGRTGATEDLKQRQVEIIKEIDAKDMKLREMKDRLQEMMRQNDSLTKEVVFYSEENERMKEMMNQSLQSEKRWKEQNKENQLLLQEAKENISKLQRTIDEAQFLSPTPLHTQLLSPLSGSRSSISPSLLSPVLSPRSSSPSHRSLSIAMSGPNFVSEEVKLHPTSTGSDIEDMPQEEDYINEDDSASSLSASWEGLPMSPQQQRHVQRAIQANGTPRGGPASKNVSKLFVFAEELEKKVIETLAEEELKRGLHNQIERCVSDFLYKREQELQKERSQHFQAIENGQMVAAAAQGEFEDEPQSSIQKTSGNDKRKSSSLSTLLLFGLFVMGGKNNSRSEASISSSATDKSGEWQMVSKNQSTDTMSFARKDDSSDAIQFPFDDYNSNSSNNAFSAITDGNHPTNDENGVDLSTVQLWVKHMSGGGASPLSSKNERRDSLAGGAKNDLASDSSPTLARARSISSSSNPNNAEDDERGNNKTSNQNGGRRRRTKTRSFSKQTLKNMESEVLGIMDEERKRAQEEVEKLKLELENAKLIAKENERLKGLYDAALKSLQESEKFKQELEQTLMAELEESEMKMKGLHERLEEKEKIIEELKQLIKAIQAEQEARIQNEEVKEEKHDKKEKEKEKEIGMQDKRKEDYDDEVEHWRKCVCMVSVGTQTEEEEKENEAKKEREKDKERVDWLPHMSFDTLMWVLNG
ncbi:hypothetical protein QOT17_025160 [Balamuthia mandrillaris]